MTSLPNLHHWQEAERAMTAGADGLRGCPFCGEPKTPYVFQTGRNRNARYTPSCPAVFGGCGGQGPKFRDIEQAKAWWNTRATDALARREPALLTALAGVAEDYAFLIGELAAMEAQDEESRLYSLHELLRRLPGFTALANLNTALARE